MSAPGPGLDASWNAGLAMAAKQGLQFGQEIVFSYGPLGFLQSPYIWYSDLGLVAFVFSSVVYLSFCIALVWALQRTLPPLASAVVAFVLLAVVTVQEQPLLIAMIASLSLLVGEWRQRAIWAFVVLAASFAAVEALVKLSTGPIVVAVFVLALLGARARRLQVLAFAVLFLAELAILWALAGQGFAAIPDFLESTWEIASGYSGAMLREVDVAPWKVSAATAIAGVTTVALVVACARAGFGDRRARWAGALAMAIAAFTVFKEGVVRTDAGHLNLYFSTAGVLWLAIPWARAHWPLMLGGAVAIVAIGLPVRPAGLPANFDPVANVRFASDQLRTAFSGSRRADLIAAGRAGMTATYSLEPQALAALGDRTVAIEPWEVGVAWAYELPWSPLPVFQDYSAYTPALDRLNAAAAESPSGPERILRENPLLVFPEFPTAELDNRYPGWDPPEQQRAVLCNFVPVQTSERWQVLSRIPDRCGDPRSLGTVEASSGETVAVPRPRPGEVVFARIGGAGVSGLERVTTLLTHAETRRLARRLPQLPAAAGNRRRRPAAARQRAVRGSRAVRDRSPGAHHRPHRDRRGAQLRVLRDAGELRLTRAASRRPRPAGARTCRARRAAARRPASRRRCRGRPRRSPPRWRGRRRWRRDRRRRRRR